MSQFCQCRKCLARRVRAVIDDKSEPGSWADAHAISSMERAHGFQRYVNRESKSMLKFPEMVLSLEKIDRMKLGPRDVMILWAIAEWPGSNGADIQRILGLPSRSRVSGQLLRLIRRGLIENRRDPEQEFQGVPSIYHPTEKGLKFCTELFGL